MGTYGGQLINSCDRLDMEDVVLVIVNTSGSPLPRWDSRGEKMWQNVQECIAGFLNFKGEPQRLISLEITVLVRWMKSSNIVLG